MQLELIREKVDELNPPKDYQSGTYDYTFANRNGMAGAFCGRGLFPLGAAEGKGYQRFLL